MLGVETETETEREEGKEGREAGSMWKPFSIKQPPSLERFSLSL